MAEMRPPEQVLYAFSHWLQQWADYALSQAQQFAASTSPDDLHAAGSQLASQENQPPAHWLELVQPGPPAHWLALFEEYGLEPPETEAPLDDMNVRSQTPGSTPRPLQDWLGEFQRGLSQFIQPSLDSLSAGPDSVEPEGTAVIPAQPIPDHHLAVDPAPASQTQGRAFPEKTAGEEGDLDVPEFPGVRAPDIDPLTTRQGEEHLAPARFSELQRPAAVRAPSTCTGEEASLERQPAQPDSDESADEPTVPKPSPAGEAVSRDRLPPSPLVERELDVERFPPPSHVSPGMPDAVPPVPPGREYDPATNPVHGAGADPAQSEHRAGEEAKSPAVRLRLTPVPPLLKPVPTPPPLADVGESASPAVMPPVKAAPQPLPRLLVGVPFEAGQPRLADPAPFVEPANESHPGEPIRHSVPLAAQENTLPRPESAETNLLPEIGPDSIPSPIRWTDKALTSNLSPRAQSDQLLLEWSQPSAAHWPELPERLPPVQPPSHVLADPTHRMRIDREQRGKPWTA